MASPWAQAATHVPTMHNGLAYTAINARTTLARPPPPSASPPSAKNTVWPQAVKDYVSRAFMSTNSVPGISHDELAAKLKSVIKAAADNNTMHNLDWTKHPLPQELILLERSQPPAQNDLPSRKRKSPDTEPAATAAIPPWRQRGLADRMDFVKAGDRKDKKQKKAQEFRSTAGVSKFNDLEKRRQRFESSLASSPHSSNFRDDDALLLANAGPVVGTNQSLEKAYFRLTAPPKPETVRPLEVLKKTIDLLVTKWKQDHNYTYICDQFKSMRQDLTVQHIKNDFTVRVYEAHARIALEKGDLGEYNQCQSQLRTLYKQKLGGRPGEFTAYRILYMIHTANRTGMNDLLADLTSTDKQNLAIKHALEVRSTLARGNYHKFFKLYEDPPNMGGYLMDMFVDRERIAAMATICRAYKPDLKVSFLTSELSFTDDQQCAQFLCDHSDEAFLEDREDGPRFLASKAAGAFEVARQKAFAMVDIKGQI
ncbi:SAC3/GANP-like protein 2 [Elsinoe fawcettii]|nr:SAC3/GANP-like protein 2 [Elsinoe fawcettii]